MTLTSREEVDKWKGDWSTSLLKRFWSPQMGMRAGTGLVGARKGLRVVKSRLDFMPSIVLGKVKGATSWLLEPSWRWEMENCTGSRCIY